MSLRLALQIPQLGILRLRLAARHLLGNEVLHGFYNGQEIGKLFARAMAVCTHFLCTAYSMCVCVLLV